jgi:hypothetical protein
LAGSLIDALGFGVYPLLAAWFVLVLLLLQTRDRGVWLVRLAGWLMLVPATAIVADRWAPPEWSESTAGAGGATAQIPWSAMRSAGAAWCLASSQPSDSCCALSPAQRSHSPGERCRNCDNALRPCFTAWPDPAPERSPPSNRRRNRFARKRRRPHRLRGLFRRRRFCRCRSTTAPP